MRQLDVFNLTAGIAEFDRYHRSRMNRICHYVGIPVIAIVVLGAMARVGGDVAIGPWVIRVDLAICVLLLTLLFDLRLNWQLASGIFASGLLAYAVGIFLPLVSLAGLFVIGWVLQIVGHRLFEKNSPAFVDNLVHFYIGPRWLINRFIRAVDAGEAVS